MSSTKQKKTANPFAKLESEATKGSGIEVWRSLLHYKWLIVFCTMVSAGISYLYYLKQDPVFQSTARLLIIKDEPTGDLPVATLLRPRAYEDNVATQMLLLKSPLVVENAVKKHELDKLNSYFGGGNPSLVIQTGLSAVLTNDRTSVIDLTFTGSNVDDCQTVLKAVIDSYKDFLKEANQSVSEETVQLIEQARGALLKELERKEEAYAEFRNNNPIVATKSGILNVHAARLNQIESNRAALLISRSQTKAELEALEAAIARGGNREALMLMMDKQGSSEMLLSGSKSRMMIDLFPMILEEQMLLEDFGPEHPKVKQIRTRIRITRNHLRSLGADDPTDASAPKGEAPDFISVFLESLREDLKSLDQKERQFNELFEEEEARARTMMAFEIRDDNMRQDIARTSQLFEGVVKRLEEVSILKDYGQMRLRILSEPSSGWQVAPVLPRILGMGVALGLFAGCAFAFLIELADKRFRSPEEIAETLGIPVVGHIPFIRGEVADKSSSLDASLCVYHSPKSTHAEAYRGVRTAVSFGTRGGTHQVIQVSSPNPGDGKSTLAANLAISIGKSGKKTLIMESDFRRPRVHRLFGLDPEIGVTSVLSGQAELSDAIQQTEVPNLYGMACGPRPANPSELLSSTRYGELIQLLREKFDYVIIDTPPLMAVTDPAVVSTRVDGVLLAFRINKRTRADCIKSTQLLTDLGANILGIVVNAIGKKEQYGYGLEHGYGNTYGTGAYGSMFRYAYSPGHYDDERYAGYYAGGDEELSIAENLSPRSKQPPVPPESLPQS